MKNDDTGVVAGDCPVAAILEEIADEVAAAAKQQPAAGLDMRAWDAGMSQNDFIAVAIGYLGRAAQKMFRNQREQQDDRSCMIKAAGILVSAIAAHDARRAGSPAGSG